MHIELIGCTGAGKTTLTRKILSAGREQGIEIILGDDFVLEKLNLNWIPHEYLRRRVLESYALYISLRNWQKYRSFRRSVLDIVNHTPGSWFYKLNLIRIVLRKIGIYELIRHSGSRDKLFLVDNEGILQAAHNLFVHNSRHVNGSLSNFVNSAPLPEMIVYLRQPSPVLIERTLRRGHPRIRHISQEKVRHFVGQAVHIFENLQTLPQIKERLLIIDGKANTMQGSGSNDDNFNGQLHALLKKTLNGDPASGDPAADETACLGLINELTRRLESGSVDYCHWKSNINLEDGLRGDSDLDFFISPASAPQLFQILDELDFKAAKIRFGPHTPGVTHHYSLDTASGKIVHLHLFTDIVTGESFVKSHHLLLEKMLSENCVPDGPVRILSKQAELVIFILRLFIKYGSLPDILRVYGESRQMRSELAWLQGEDNVGKSLALLNKFCPTVSENLFLNCIEAIHENKSFLKRFRLAKRIRKALKPFALYSYPARIAAYTGVLMAKLRCRLQGDLKNKRLESGGAVIAIVGADATGKSTLVSETERWLGKIFAVRKVHVGKPPSTLLTLPLNILLPLSRRLFPHLRRSHMPPKPADLPETSETEKVPASLFFAVRALSLAWDRHRLLVKVAHARSKGELIICDRYPSEQTGAMDSPRLAQKAAQKGLKAAIFNRLAGMENRLYSRMPPPDIAVRLTVPLETAIRRNQARIKSDKDSDEFIEVRHQRAGRWHKKDTKHYFEIDTEQSLAATILEIKKVIWESL